MNNDDAHWRDSARTPKFFIFDYRLIFFILFGIVAPAIGLGDYALYIFLVLVLIAVFFAVLENFKFTIPVFKRWLLSTVISGKLKKAKPWS